MRDPRTAGALVVGWSACAVLVGYLDLLTGPYVSLTLFYLAPVVGAAWFGRRRDGLLVALVAAISSLISDVLLGSVNTQATLLWNTASRTMVLVVAALVVNQVRSDARALETMDAQRSRLLQLIDRGLAGPAKELIELVDHWDGGVEQLRAMLRPRAETIAFMARDFADTVRLESGTLPVGREKLDLLALVQEIRREEMRDRRVTVIAPNERVFVLADGARVRQSIASLLDLSGDRDELTLSLAREAPNAELVISSQGLPDADAGAADTRDEISLAVELARMIFSAQGGSLDVLRNPITRSVRATARLPLA